MKRKICVVTGSRADYGLLKPLLDQLSADKRCQLQLIATGSHLSEEFGETIADIYADGFMPSREIVLPLGNSALATANSISIAIKKFFTAYSSLKPDIIVVLGDRYEIFSAACAGFIQNIPLAHIHGGELTEGVLDDGFRHMITKMSWLHFTAASVYRDRVIQLGENPRRVFNVGAIGLDNLSRLKFLSCEQIQQQLDLCFKANNLLVTFHPVMLADRGLSQLGNLFSALNTLKNTLVIFTYANADSGGEAINKNIETYVRQHKDNAAVFKSLGQLRYLSLMKYMDAVVGNSSSGIIEAPSLKVPTINIGDRQKGRIHADSVIDCLPSTTAIIQALRKIYSPAFYARIKNFDNPYKGKTSTAEAIKMRLLKKDCLAGTRKTFFDIIKGSKHG